MGLRDNAEKIVVELDERDAKQAAATAEMITAAEPKFAEKLSEWAAGMGLESAPDYVVRSAVFNGDGEDDYPSVRTALAFEVDGIAFTGRFKLYRGRVSYGVVMDGEWSTPIQSVEGLASVLRRQQRHPPQD